MPCTTHKIEQLLIFGERKSLLMCEKCIELSSSNLGTFVFCLTQFFFCLQVYLQQLNFLSVGVAVDGVYSDLMVSAVRSFQESHNKHERGFSPTLLEDGHLTPVTFQYLRQAYLTLYASMFR